MGHGKETPRQKMIGMMYLVLTALLALNVSKSILDAFVVVNNGLEVTNKNFKNKNQVLYNEFEKQLGMNPAKVKAYYDAANEVKAETQKVCDTIYALKKELLIRVDGGDIDEPAGENNDKNGDGRFTVDDKILDLMLVNSKDNYDIPTNMFCGTDVTGKGAAAERLKNLLISFKENLLSILGRDKIAILNKEQVLNNYKENQFGVNTNDPENAGEDASSKYWETQNFYYLASVACVTMLSKMENDVRNAESDVVSTLLGQIGAADFKFDTLAAKVIAKSNYVIQGGKYEADLFVAAFSTTDDPVIIVGEGLDTNTMELIGDTTHIPVQKGVGKFVVDANAVGAKKYSAVIKVKSPTGDYKTYPLRDIEYMVAKPAAVVSPTKMNVFYMGVENPVDISVSGFSSEKISATLSGGGSISKSSNGYIVKVNRPGETKVNVSVKMDDGSSKSMGSPVFRVKRLPNPVPKVAGKGGGPISKNELSAQSFVKAEMEGFDFDLNVKVTGFTVSAIINGFNQEKKVSGSKISDEQRTIISRAKSGTKVYFDDIKAYMPDGSTRDLGSISFRIN